MKKGTKGPSQQATEGFGTDNPGVILNRPLPAVVSFGGEESRVRAVGADVGTRDPATARAAAFVGGALAIAIDAGIAVTALPMHRQPRPTVKVCNARPPSPAGIRAERPAIQLNNVQSPAHSGLFIGQPPTASLIIGRDGLIKRAAASSRRLTCNGH